MSQRLLAIVGLLTLLALAERAASEAGHRVSVSELKPLLVRAIEDGTAQGVLIGASAEYLRRTFDTASPIEIDVRVLHPLPQSGCSRLLVTTRQRNVLEKSTRNDQELTYQISYCRDGRFPDAR